MAIIIRCGVGNQIERPAASIQSTDDIGPAIFAALGASSDNHEFVVEGQSYTGPLSDGDIVTIRQKANTKG